MSASRLRSLIILLLFAVAGLGARCGPAATFTVLGPLPQYDITSSTPESFTIGGALSRDGQIVAGRGRIHVPGTVNPIELIDVPFRYRNGALQTLDSPFSFHPSVSWVNMSPNGRKIFVSWGVSLTGFYTWEGSSLTFTDLAPQISSLYGIAASTPDGSILLGNAAFSGTFPTHPFLYQAGVVTQLVDPTGNHVLYGGIAMSADGTLVTGYTQRNESYLLDTTTGSFTLLGALDPTNVYGTLPAAMTPDGSVIVGTAGVGTFGFEPYRWEGGQMVGLGTLPGATAVVGATDVSADGNVVVGGAIYNDLFNEDDAFVWDPTNGMRKLSDALTAQGVDLTGWKLESANAVSAGGQTILGTAIDAKGNRYAFLAELARTPAPATP